MALAAEIHGDQPLSHDNLPPDTVMLVWWAALCAVSAVNLCVYACALTAAARQPPAPDAPTLRYQRRMRLLAGPFVAACAWRSFFPNLYDARTVLFSSPACSILLARFLACVAELSWTGQIASALAQIGGGLGSSCGKYAAVAMWLPICVAQCFSFAGVATTCSLWFAFEESLWGVSFAVACVTGSAFFCPCRRILPAGQRWSAAPCFLLAIGAWGLVYVPWEAFVNVPGLIRDWRAEQAGHKVYLHFVPGLADAAVTENVDKHFATWESHLLWMTMYFTVCVWSSVWLVRAPRLPQVKAAADPLPAPGGV